ncbi:MAG: PorV/PorQ family protein [Elusimicrobia bacterium]|nr:PorV/PorQ family protein [Elusimicrobiota bacterium]
MNNFKKIISVIVAGIYLVSLGQFAVNWAEQKGTGGMPGAFMSWGAGARSLGMGKAFVALADDASATYWNPAGLARLSRSELTALHSILWGGTVYDFISYVQPTQFGGTFGFSGTRLFLGGFEGRDELNRVTHTFADIQSAYGASYGQKVLQTLSIGANLKKMSHTLDDHASGSYIVDIGALYSPLEMLNIGVNLQNLLALTYGTEDELPIIARFGMNYKLLRQKLLIGTDLEATIGWSRGIPYHMGAEYWAMSYLALRMGIDPQEFNMGFGLRYEDYGLDYAYATHDMGGSHRISATISFGTSVKKIKEKTAREYEVEGDVAYREGLYSNSVRSFEKAYSLNPSNRDLERKLNVLSKISRILPVNIKRTAKSDLIKRGIIEYLEKENSKVLILSLNHIITENPTDQQAKELLRLIASIEGIQDPKIRVAEGMSLVEFKLHKALQFFYDGNYAKVIEECQDVLVLEPESAQAYKRMGSAFYAIGNEEKALSSWRKSLNYNPADKSLMEFISRVEKDIARDSKEVEEKGVQEEEE